MKPHSTRRDFLKTSALVAGGALAVPAWLRASDEPNAAAAGATPGSAAAPATAPLAKLPPAPIPIAAPAGFGVAAGPFQPTWESLAAGFAVPEWFRDAKLGIWAHWGPQCQPEMGDWYAQRMYQPKNAAYKFHVQKYGHPSKFGFKDVIHEWKAERWDPAHLLGLYKRAGAKYFAAMANHHDNTDLWDSKYQPWNSVRVGPKKDLVGGWARATREAGLRLALTCHGDRAWSWYQDAQHADTEGPLAGVPYDGLLGRAEGKGQWWDGLDPQDLYAQYHAPGKYNWQQNGTPPIDPAFAERFFRRTIDLIDQHHPDLLYFDDTVLPIYPATDIGLRIAAYYYNTSLARHGKLDAVIATKGLNPDQRRALLLDVERGVTSGGESLPWQTDTCIGSWHYERRLLEEHRYKTAGQVAQMLVDIVSKNGNLQLSIPLPGHGEPDADELAFLAQFTAWMDVCAEGIHGTRPWKVYGEGPSVTNPAPKGRFGGAQDVRTYTAQDFRFMQKGDALYAFAMGWPDNGRITITSLAENSPHAPGAIERVELLGVKEPLKFTRDAAGVSVALPEKKPCDYAWGFRINGRGLTTVA